MNKTKEDKELYNLDIKSGCWNFTGCILKCGYGQMRRNKKRIYAHRYFYEKYKGDIPKN